MGSSKRHARAFASAVTGIQSVGNGSFIIATVVSCLLHTRIVKANNIRVKSDSSSRAEELQGDLAQNVNALLDSNRELSQRMMQLEHVLNTPTIRPQTIRSNLTTATSKNPTSIARLSNALIPSSTKTFTPASSSDILPVFEFERDLQLSLVYRQAQRGSIDYSLHSSAVNTHGWSKLSAYYSVADISALSVAALPLNLKDVTNKHHYTSNIYQKQPYPLIQERSILHDSLTIHSQLCQIPGFQELFDAEWQVQRAAHGVDPSVNERHGDDSEWIWQLDLFSALKSVFRKDLAYGLLADKLGWTLDRDIHQQPGPARNRATGMPISVFRHLCFSRLGLAPGNSFKVKDALAGDNVRFLRVSLVRY